jgi:hypothetical protein
MVGSGGLSKNIRRVWRETATWLCSLLSLSLVAGSLNQRHRGATAAASLQTARCSPRLKSPSEHTRTHFRPATVLLQPSLAHPHCQTPAPQAGGALPSSQQ